MIINNHLCSGAAHFILITLTLHPVVSFQWHGSILIDNNDGRKADCVSSVALPVL